MKFPEYNFDKMNETDVREEIISPLLRHLGYRSGTSNDIIREQQLTYPKISLGRKKKTDPAVRGRADYICLTEDQISWVIEAKSPECKIDKDAIEQSYTYANHPEVRAVYFSITNGIEYFIYQTNYGPEKEAIFYCNYDELTKRLPEIQNLLTPASLLRDFPDQKKNMGIPLGQNLRSTARVTSGLATYQNNNFDIKPLTDLIMTITGGSLERNEDGHLQVQIDTLVPIKQLQTLNEKLGISSMVLISEDNTISSDINKPSIFTTKYETHIQAGELLFDINTWQDILNPIDLSAVTTFTATGYIDKNLFIGKFDTKITFRNLPKIFQAQGIFEIRLA